MRKKILVVDDDQDLLRGLAVRLNSEGYEVIFATDAVFAVTYARRERPDLIILDIGLPGGDGFLVMDRIKSTGNLATIPVIILSARDPQMNREKSFEHGAVAFIQKPADNFVLLSTIHKVLGDSPPPARQKTGNYSAANPVMSPNASEYTAPEIGEIILAPPVPVSKVHSGAQDAGIATFRAPELTEESQKQSAAAPAPAPVCEPKTSKSILIVDDDHDLLLAMSVRLMSFGYNVFFTYDVVSALTKARKVRPDIMILDIGLPGGDGFDVMEHMKRTPELAETPVVILTARDSETNRVRATQLGAKAFIKKPADNRELIDIIRKILG